VFKNGQFLAIFAQNTFIFDKKCKKMQISDKKLQKTTKKC